MSASPRMSNNDHRHLAEYLEIDNLLETAFGLVYRRHCQIFGHVYLVVYIGHKERGIYGNLN